MLPSKKPVYLLLLLACLACSGAFSQALFHSIGGAYMYGIGDRLAANQYAERPQFSLTGISYFPRVNVVEGKASSLSVGLPLAVGFQGHVSSNNENSIGFGFDAPIVVDFNMGSRSTYSNESGFGGYFGAGFGYTYTTYH